MGVSAVVAVSSAAAIAKVKLAGRSRCGCRCRASLGLHAPRQLERWGECVGGLDLRPVITPPDSQSLSGERARGFRPVPPALSSVNRRCRKLPRPWETIRRPHTSLGRPPSLQPGPTRTIIPETLIMSEGTLGQGHRRRDFEDDNHATRRACRTYPYHDGRGQARPNPIPYLEQQRESDCCPRVVPP